MKNQITEIVFILDKSGSMYGLEADTIGGFNSTLSSQKEQAQGEAFVTTVLFNDRMETIHDRLPIKEVNPLTRDDYFVGGATALLDAVGTTITHIKEIHKYARKEDVPNKTIFIITTDGMENASYEYRAEQIKKMIEQETKNGWEFIFLGANIDVVSVAKEIGIDEDKALKFKASKKGVKKSFDIMAEAIYQARCDKKIDLEKWKREE